MLTMIDASTKTIHVFIDNNLYATIIDTTAATLVIFTNGDGIAKMPTIDSAKDYVKACYDIDNS